MTQRGQAAAAAVVLRSPSGEIVYTDSFDHFENGLLRLLQMERDEFDLWLAYAEEEPDSDLLVRLGAALKRLRPLPAAVEGEPVPVEPGPRSVAGRLWHRAIAESPDYGMARANDGTLAWLVQDAGGRFARETDAPSYEEQYFEGDRAASGGYGDYTSQAGWRLEKARRQVHELQSATGLERGRVLDVGCGYGYFRLALEEAGFAHDGLEVSAFARGAANRLYGFETYAGTLDDYVGEFGGRYDAVTLFDLVEHVPEPADFMRVVAACVRPGGFVAIKTPNIDCPEADHLGPYYHSLKREHLVLFSIASLTDAASSVGLRRHAVWTTSHLLGGFVGRKRVEAWSRELRGADIIAYFAKRGV